MKRFLLALGLVVAISSYNNTADAQSVSVNINIGSQPAWGPVGYDYAAYYYFPDIDIYYNVDRSVFHYLNRGRWVSSRYLPYSYSRYDLYRMYKVVINDRDPWRYHTRYRKQYSQYRGNHSQVIILNSRDNRYSNSRNNRVNWIESDRQSNGRTSTNGRTSSDNNRSSSRSDRSSNGRQTRESSVNSSRSSDRQSSGSESNRSSNRSSSSSKDRSSDSSGRSSENGRSSSSDQSNR